MPISNVIEEDDYIATADLNMPTNYLASTTPRLQRGMAIKQREALRVSKILSNSDNQLLANNRKLQTSYLFYLFI